ncbi:substrate-binding domain-containing protein [Sphaerisporangium sp. TRM90804]|uniref:substrate-binding domain-containing protein n=1 Tax=Sphaerisporangium sp. TRM90804 TaxID=3031113 RepID=UPI00244BFB1A|nr:substrate-binding domain-containing protein [Sphaerisporangium sp. TRM90804]MDH2427830.1 substrate-binding domain-containing protein [Sphaerisporangium sp. TRM90804]
MLAAVIALVLLGGVLVLVFDSAGGACSARDPVLVGVDAAVDIAPVAMEAAERFNTTKAAVNGRCVLVQVTEQPPAPVLRTLIGDRAGVPEGRPDAWIADSSAWVRLARKSGAPGLAPQEKVVATSPLVFATRRSLAERFATGGTEMSWEMVFPATARGRLRPTEEEPDVVRVPDPSVAGAGIATVAAARDIAGTGGDGPEQLTAFVRMAQAGSAPDYRTMVAAVDDRSFWRRPVVVVPEQAVWLHGRTASDDPVVALHPKEGTIALDYPYVVTAEDPSAAAGARLFGDWLGSAETRAAVRRGGFRLPDGRDAPPDAGPAIPPGQPKPRPSINPAMIDEALDAWSRLAPPSDILVLADASRHMAEPIAGRKGATRHSVALEAARMGLQLFPDTTRMGLWEFADGFAGGKGHRALVGLGPINQPGREDDQFTRRTRLDQLTRTLKADKGRDSSLYDTILAGFREVTAEYDPAMNNSVLVITAGRDDGTGLSRRELAERLREEWDPDNPVQIIVIAFGADVDRSALGEITALTNGSVHVASEPGEIIEVFLSALARRLCHPTCTGSG